MSKTAADYAMESGDVKTMAIFSGGDQEEEPEN